MVLLTMTPALVAAVKVYNESRPSQQEEETVHLNAPSLANPVIGNPISHAQVIDIARFLKNSDSSHDAVVSDASNEPSQSQYNLDTLLRGSHIYTPPPPPKPEQTQEYKDLMARLRHESEARAYASISSTNSSSNPFSISSKSSLALSTPTHDPFAKPEDDEITFADVNRQLALIINVLVSIIACGIAIWLVAGHVAAPKRLALAMGGALVVAVAEVAIYAGYLRRLGEAKEKERGRKERKVVKKTWTIAGSLLEKHGGDVSGQEKTEEVNGTGVRYRAGKRR